MKDRLVQDNTSNGRLAQDNTVDDTANNMAKMIQSLSRGEQNLVLTTLVMKIQRDRRNEIQTMKDSIETIEKDNNELRDVLLNTGSMIIQEERGTK